VKKEKWLGLDGRAIQQITWADTETEQGRSLTITPVQTLTMNVEYMGDRTEAWVVGMRHGKEFARYNARYVEMIVWTDDEIPTTS
jgi:hypothetical protein